MPERRVMARRVRRQHVSFPGLRGVKLGVPSGLSDLYYHTMEMRWPSFVGLVTATFIVLNIAFGLIYAALPGSLLNAEPGSIADGFFFSVETLGTVGYGTMAPATRLGHSIAATEILVGLFFSATITGLIFARFARPRDSLIFSEIAVIGRYDGKRALMVRLTSSRARPLADATAQMAWLERVVDPHGRVLRRLIDLPLVRSHNALMGLSWTLTHILEKDSPMLAALRDADRFTLTVTISGIDTLLASQSISGRTYLRHEILIDHDFVDVLDEVDGVLQLDMSKFHLARPLTEP
jgi:inward rectifier potassium channel